MSNRQDGSGRERFVHQENTSSDDLSWRREPVAKDHTTIHPTAVGPTASSIVTVPEARHPYRFGAQGSPQYNSTPHVYPPYDYGALGLTYPGSRAHYPPHGVGASGPPYGVRAPGHASYSHGLAAHDLPFHGFGDPRAHAKSSYNHHESPQDQATRPHKRRSDAVGDGKLHEPSEVEPENILDKGHAKQTRHNLKVHGLASLADKKAVIGVFGDCNLSEDMVHNVIHPDGNPTGEIFLEFISEEDAKKAMSKNKTMIGSDLIEIIPSTLEDLPIKNTKRRKESGCHDRVEDSNDKEIMGPDGHDHGKPKRSNDKEKSVHPTASSIVTVPEARHPYRFGAQGSPQYNSTPHVYPPYDYGALGLTYPGSRAHYPPYPGSRAHYPPYPGSRAHYPPYPGSRAHYPPYPGSRAHYPPHGVGASGPPYGVRAPGHASYSHGLAAHDLPFHGFGYPRAHAKSSYNHHESPQDQATGPHKRRSDAVGDGKLHGPSEVELENILDKGHAKQTRHILKVHGLASLADKKVVIGVFGDCNLSEDMIHNVIHPDGNPTGEIFLEFISEEDAKKAMSKNKTMIGSDLIEIIPSTLEDLPIKNTKRRKESGCHDGVEDSNDKEIMGPDGHSHGKPKRSNDKEKSVYPTASSIVTVPEARHPCRFGAQGSPQYNSTPHVYPPYDYGALGLTYPGSRAHYPPYPGSRAHYPPYPGSRAHYPPYPGSRAHYPPYPGSRAHYPPHGVGASGPPYGVRAPGHASYSHGLAAHDLPFHGFGDPRAHAKSSYNHHESPQDQATRPHKRRSDAVGDGKLHGPSEVEPENILDKGHAKQTRHILKVHGLASLADKKAVIGVFGDCNLSEDMIHNVIHPDGNPTGEIFLEFISEEDAKKAMSKNKTMIGSDLIEIIPSTLEDLPIKNTKRRKESGCHDRVEDSNDKEIMGPDGHSHGKPKRSNDKEKSVHPTASSIVTVPEARHPCRFGAQGSPQYNSAPHVYRPYDYGAYGITSYGHGTHVYPSHGFRAKSCVPDTCTDKSVADVSPNIPGRCHYVLAIENMEKDLSTSTVTKFIHKETTIFPEAHIFPSLKTDLFTRGILKVHTEREFKKLLEFLENPNHIIVSSRNRPWVVTEILSGEDYMGTIMEHCNDMESNSELKVICSGTDEYLVSKEHKENYTEFNRHQKLVFGRLAFEEEKISRQFGK